MNNAVPVIFFHLDRANVGLTLEEVGWSDCALLLGFSPILGRLTGAKKVKKNNLNSFVIMSEWVDFYVFK